MIEEIKIFKDRKDAGRQLAAELLLYREQNPLILGIPRGGVIVAAEVSKVLNADLDVMVARKIGAPGFPEFAIGAIAPDNIVVLNTETSNIDKLIAAEQKEMERRINLYRAGKKLKIAGRIVILVDDGLATGLTAIAAARSLVKQKAKKIILAIPVASKEAVTILRKEVDEVVCLFTPPNFEAVGSWYQNFGQTTDEEVLAAINK